MFSFKKALVLLVVLGTLVMPTLAHLDIDAEAQQDEVIVTELINYNRNLKTEVETIGDFLVGSKNVNDSLANEYARLIVKYSTRNRLPPGLVAGIVMQESYGDSAAVSRAGAIGLMQVMPTYWNNVYPDCGDNLFNPETNVCYGTRVFRHFLDSANGSVKKALSAYNGDKTLAYAHRVLMWTGTFCAGLDS